MNCKVVKKSLSDSVWMEELKTHYHHNILLYIKIQLYDRIGWTLAS
jgi:hypothetical protein